MHGRRDFLCSSVAGLVGSTLSPPLVPKEAGHVAWVVEVLREMLTVKGGMTRDELLRVFQTEGGLSTGLERTFVSRQCPYFKVDIKFKAVGRGDRDPDGRVTAVEDGRDVITSISRPPSSVRHLRLNGDRPLRTESAGYSCESGKAIRLWLRLYRSH